ncbi:MAG: hypothetical protein ACTSVO_05675 [Candidatus Heimdallarchaeaceae archaeon]
MKCPVCNIDFGDYIEELKQHCDHVHLITLEDVPKPAQSINAIPVENGRGC